MSTPATRLPPFPQQLPTTQAGWQQLLNAYQQNTGQVASIGAGGIYINGTPVLDPVSGNFAYYAQTAAELAAGVTPTNYAYPPFDLRRYGADPTGASASDTSLANAISVCGTNGGTIRAVAGTYKFANQYSFSGKHSIIIQGDGGNTNNASAATIFTYSGTAAPFVSFASAYGCYLRDVVLQTSNAGFTGFFASTATGNSFMCGVEHCFLECLSQCGGISLDTVIGFSIWRTIVDHGSPCITGQNSAGGSFSNVVDIIGCQLTHANGSYAIGYLGDNWNIIGNDFEPSANGVLTAIQNTTSTLATGLVVAGNFMSDATAASSPITLCVYGASITGNFINSGAATGSYPTFGNVGPAITLSSSIGVTVSANNFANCSYLVGFADANSRAIRVSENRCTNTNTIIGQYNTNAPYDLQFNPNYNASAATESYIPPSGATFGNFSANGFEVSPNANIHMWGSATVTEGTPLAITFSTAVGRSFPNTFWNGIANAASAGYSVSVSSGSTTGMTLTLNGGAGSSTVYWGAYGN